MAATHQEISGIYQKTAWRSPEGDYIIGFLQDGVTVKGAADPAELAPNLPYRFFGAWKDGNGKYGPSFHFVCFVKDLPHSRDAIVQYLLRQLRGAAVGIGHATAHRLYDLYQADAVRKLRMDAPAVAAAVNLPIEKAREAARILEADSKLENCKIELMGLFAGKHFPRATIKECVDKWGPRAASMIRRDAFLLLTSRIKGAGFSRCDDLYLSNGGDPARLKRQTLCAWHGLQSNSDGHTWHPVATATNAIRSKVDGVNIDPIKAIKLGLKTDWLSIRTVGFNIWLADGKKAKNEAAIANKYHEIAINPPAWPEVTDAGLSDHQREQLALATRSRIAILAGTPGTGKTYTAAALIRAIVARHGLGAVAIHAPTGKAAVRITEVMQQKYNLPLRAVTTHRLLCPGTNGHGTGEWGFQFNEDRSIPIQFLIGDETSMDDVDLFAALLRACTPRTHLLFLGDPYQLAPVGHGAPLRDLLAAGAPHGELKEIHRNAGLIVEACQAIKDGRDFKTATTFDDAGNNLKLIQVSGSAGVVNELRKMFTAMIEAGKRDVFEDVQIITPLNEKSDLGRTKLNAFLQSLLNPKGASVPKCKYRVGDKVICLSNDNYPTSLEQWAFVCGSCSARFEGRLNKADCPVCRSECSTDQKQTAPKVPVCNGEVGRITAVDETRVAYMFPDTGEGERPVCIPRKSEWADSFDLGYAITCHKAQGSEWPIVVVIADEAADRVASREWYYTAISRASERCIILGRMATIAKQCRRVTLRDRKTFLRELLLEAEGI